MPDQYSEREIQAMFRRWIETEAGSQRAAAKKLGVTVGYVNDMAQGRRRISDGALRRLGIKRSVKEVYETR